LCFVTVVNDGFFSGDGTEYCVNGQNVVSRITKPRKIY